MANTNDFTAIAACHFCNVRGPCRVFHDTFTMSGTPACRHCEPVLYEEVVRAEIDWWLAGGDRPLAA